jgi:hypothetical protein
MNLSPRVFAAGAALAMALVGATASSAGTVVLTFEGLGNLEPVFNYYDGGLAGDGSGPGPSDGITFNYSFIASEWLNDDYLSAPPSGVMMAGIGDSSGVHLINVAAGFTAFSFDYAAADPGSVYVLSGAYGAGDLLAQLSLPTTPDGYDHYGWAHVEVPFAGTAQSVIFHGSVFNIAFDDMTFGGPSSTLDAAPEPATWAMLILGVGMIGIAARRRRESRALVAA